MPSPPPSPVPWEKAGNNTPPRQPELPKLKRRIRGKLNNFQYGGPLHKVPDILAGGKVQKHPHIETADRIEEARIRFTMRTLADLKSKLCSTRDRAAVLDVYQHGLKIINDRNHVNVKYEVDLQVNIILGLRDPKEFELFFTNKMLLPPLEPLYAHPRIEFRDDPHERHADWRLREWKKDGWPDKWPEGAITRERELSEGNKNWKRELWLMVDWEDEAHALINVLDEKDEMTWSNEIVHE